MAVFHGKKVFIRLLAAIICLCLIGAGAAAFTEGGAEKDKDIMSIRFGDAADVTLDENGDPVLVNGYPLRTVESSYYDKGQRKSYSIRVDFVDYPFWQASTQYNGSLAVMSLAMALSSSRPAAKGAEAKTEDSAQNLERFLTEAGFSDIRTDDYSKTPSMYTVSTGIGCRRMEAEGQEPFTLIAIGICGSNYQNEWEANMTPGNGDVHAGFKGASDLIVDRLAGYIATRGIQGRIKVWLSGFSRAAAISNLTAAALADTAMFPREDIYAYTFATPAAVKNPPSSGYEHIFNIICPMDLVPQVMPADWGFGRYGTDLFVAVNEFSSVLGGMATKIRATIDEELYHVINRYSPELNFRMRLLISLVLDVLDSQEYYNRYFQPALVGIMQDRTLPNALITLRKLMSNMDDGDPSQRDDMDELMDYFIRLFNSSVRRSGLGATDENTATALYRLFNEHNENSYLANIDAIQNGIFEPSTKMCYVMVRGPVTVAVNETGEDQPVCSIDAEGAQRVKESDEKSEDAQDSFYMERCGDVTILAVPRDVDYTVSWTAEGSGTVECLAAGVSVHASRTYPCFRSRPVPVQAGDTGVVFRQADGELAPLDGFDAMTLNGRQLAEFAGIASLGINWRIALMLACAALGLAVCVFACIAGARQPQRRKQYGFACWLALCLFGVAALETELAYWFFADQPLLRIAWKAVVGACLLFLLFRVHPPVGNLLQTLFPALVLALIADSAITFSFEVGAGIYLLAHIVLIAYFLRCQPLSRGRWLQWALSAIPLAALIACFIAPNRGAVGWAAAVFAPVAMLMAASSVGQPARVRAGVMLIIAADCLLGVFMAFINEPILHALYMFFIYLALLLLAISAPLNPDKMTRNSLTAA